MEQKKKRIKRIFSSFGDLPHLWANQVQPDGKCGNGFFEDNIIYSYGRHFPIASIYTDKEGVKTVFFTTATYSNTTRDHISSTKAACSHMNILYMKDVVGCLYFGEMSYTHKENIKEFCFKINELIPKFSKAKENKSWIYQSMYRECKLLEKYITFFKIKSRIDSTTKKLIKLVESDKWSKEIEAYANKKAARLTDPLYAEKLKKAKLYREKKALTADADQITKWRNYKAKTPYLKKGRYSYSDYWCKHVLLRYDANQERIETSKGVKIPLETAKRFWTFIKIVLAKGGCATQECCNYKVLDMYNVTQITEDLIIVGCHKIEMTEIKDMVELLGLEN